MWVGINGRYTELKFIHNERWLYYHIPKLVSMFNELDTSSSTTRSALLFASLAFKTNRLFQCESEHCRLQFSTQFTAMLHYQRMHREKLFECKILTLLGCQSKFAIENYLKKHVEGIHGEKMNCPAAECKTQFSHKNHMKAHYLCVHTDIRPFRCIIEDCTISCATLWDLREHTRVSHNDKPFICCH